MMARILAHQRGLGNGVGLHYSGFHRFSAVPAPSNQLLASIPPRKNRYYCQPIREDGLSDRGAIFAAARHAVALYQWSSQPDNAQQAAINAAAAHLTMVAGRHSPLLGAAYAVHTWLERGGDRPPLRAALARYWVDRGVTTRPCPLLTGAAALAAAVPWTPDLWVG